MIAHRPPDFDKAENAYLLAEQLDHYNARAWVGHAYLKYLAWQSRGRDLKTYGWKTIPALLLEGRLAAREIPTPGRCTANAPR